SDSSAETLPQQTPRRRLQPEQRRAVILEAAARLFAQRGYHGASMMDIAADAGIAASVIYDHFATKRDLHLELLNQQASAMAAAPTPPPAGPSGEDLARHATAAFFRFVEETPSAGRMLFRDPPADAETAAVHAAIHRRNVAAIVGMIALAP